ARHCALMISLQKDSFFRHVRQARFALSNSIIASSQAYLNARPIPRTRTLTKPNSIANGRATTISVLIMLGLRKCSLRLSLENNPTKDPDNP
ncbi:MAG TPA: hypothetical protein VJ323_09875, partial [Bryobacteraceae bacterium]|nr:hypothetical protein [Bryobacteraceae bacterium]